MGNGDETIAFWLMPAAEPKAVFASVIDELAIRLNAPAFEPHVTLQGAAIEEPRAMQVLEQLAAMTAPMRLRVQSIEFSEQYTKTLYVQFRPSREAAALSDEIARQLGGATGYAFDPHVSLLYRAMPQSEKAALAREVKIPFEWIGFDAVKLVGIPRPIEGPEDVRAWRVIAERRLQGESR